MSGVETRYYLSDFILLYCMVRALLNKIRKNLVMTHNIHFSWQRERTQRIPILYYNSKGKGTSNLMDWLWSYVPFERLLLQL